MTFRNLWKGGPNGEISVQVDEETGEVFVTNLQGSSSTVQVRPNPTVSGALIVSSPQKMVQGEDEGEPAILVC